MFFIIFFSFRIFVLILEQKMEFETKNSHNSRGAIRFFLLPRELRLKIAAIPGENFLRTEIPGQMTFFGTIPGEMTKTQKFIKKFVFYF